MASHDALADRIRTDLTTDVQKAKRRCFVMGALLVLATGYLGWIYTMAGEFNAEEAARIARVELESELPGLEEKAEDAIMEAAPQVLDRAEKVVLEAPATLRSQLQKGLDSSMDRLVATLEQGLNEELSREIDELTAQLDRETLETTDVEEMLARLRQIHRERTEVLVDVLYVGYSEEVAELDGYLQRLQRSDDLDERELAHKEIIEATVALRGHMNELSAPFRR